MAIVLWMKSGVWCTSSPNCAINKFWNIKSRLHPSSYFHPAALNTYFLFVPLFKQNSTFASLQKIQKCKTSGAAWCCNAACVSADQWVALSRTRGFTIKKVAALQYLDQECIWFRIMDLKCEKYSFKTQPSPQSPNFPSQINFACNVPKYVFGTDKR